MASLSFDIFWRDHGARRGMGELEEGATRSQRAMAAFKVAGVAAATAAGAALFEMGKRGIEVANDISESTSKIGVVFGQSAKSVLDFTETTATGLGISKRSAMEAVGTFGNLLVSLKLPQEQAAKMSTKMVTLAADMASFNNASPEEALDAIRSGLMGETEPLQRFGVNMNDATLRTQALKMGLVKNVKEGLSPAVKAQAAYGLMLAQTGTAQGDFSRTSNGLANQQRILKARFEDLEGELGAKLLPAVNKVAAVMLSLLDTFEKNQKVIVPLVGALAGFATLVWGINKATAAWTATQAAWTAVMGTATARTNLQTAAVARLRAGMILLGPATALVAAGMAGAFAGDALGKWQAGTVNVNNLTKAMKDNIGTMKLSRQEISLFESKGLLGFRKETLNSSEALEHFGTAAYNALDQGWDARLGRWQSMGSAQSKFKKQTEQLDASFAQMVAGGNVKGAEEQMRLYEDAAKKAGVPVASLRQMFPKYTEAVKNSTPVVKAATGATEKHAIAVKQDTDKLRENAVALGKLRGSENSFEAAIDDASDSLKENGATLDVHTKKGRNNRAALDTIASSTLDWVDAMKESGASQKKQDAALERGRTELIKTGQRFGMTKKEAKKYAEEILGIPKRYASTITLGLKNNIPRTLFGVKVGGYGQGLGVLRAHGGSVFGAGTETSDSIPAWLSHNEHVWTAKEVKAAGGHGAVEAMRRGVLQRHATGGSVDFGRRLAAGVGIITAGTTSEIAKVIKAAADKAIGFNPSLAGALNFARAQVGKPYIWGGVGPRGYDCSGFMSALLNVVQGRNPYQRRFATGSFPSAGFVSGPGAFMIGSRRGNPGHMAGTINGVNVESTGSVGVHMGRSARGARDSLFTGLYHLKGYRAGGPVGDPPFDQLNPNSPDYLGNEVRNALLFDKGGMLRNGGVAVNRSGRAERVLSGRQTNAFDNLVRVVDRGLGSGAGNSPAGESLDYAKLAQQMTKAIANAGLAVKLDGRTVGTVMGNTSSILGRAG